MTNNDRLFLSAILGCVIMLAGSQARAGLNVGVVFNDPGSTYSAYYTDIQNAMTAAADAWGAYIETRADKTLQIEVNFTTEKTASAGSKQLVPTTPVGGVTTYMVGAISKMVFGGSSGVFSGADAVFNIGENWLRNVIWWNPDPGSIAGIPSNKIDSHYVFMHELGHILGFASARDTAGNLPTLGGRPYQTTYDAQTEWNGGNLFFTGDAAMTAYGGNPVPLTYENWSHYGNKSPRPGADLVSDVMNGVESHYATLYKLSGTDVGLLADLGYELTAAGRALVYGNPPTAVPEPASVIAMVVGLSGVGAWRAAAGRRRAA